MSFENPHRASNKQEKGETVPKQGRIAHALASLTNGLLAQNMDRKAESGIFIAALEKAAETNVALAKFDPDGTLGATLEQGVQNLFEQLLKQRAGNKQS
jgi:hypothetical protein